MRTGPEWAGAIAARRKADGHRAGKRGFSRSIAFSRIPGNRRRPPRSTFLAGHGIRDQESARVINMSFAGPYDPMLQMAMKKAPATKGVVLDRGCRQCRTKSPPLYPAARSNVIASRHRRERQAVRPRQSRPAGRDCGAGRRHSGAGAQCRLTN